MLTYIFRAIMAEMRYAKQFGLTDHAEKLTIKARTLLKVIRYE